MKVDLKGSVFVFTGALKKMTRYEAEAAIEKAGAKTGKSVGSKTSYLIAGKRSGSKYNKALNMGIPILSEDDFQALIEGDTVEVEEVGKAGDRSVDELLGEVRSVMQGNPTPKMWSQLVALLDDCREEDVHVLTEYIDGYIARWTDDQMKGQTGTNRDASTHETRRMWWAYHGGGVDGELRVAPEHWVGQMQQGVDSPKFKIVRALDFTTTKVTSTAVDKVLQHATLEHLEVLELPDRLVPSKTLIQTLCGHPTLGYLRLGKIDGKTGGFFKAHGKEPGSLHTLDLIRLDHAYRLRGAEAITEFVTAPYFDSVKSLHIAAHDESEHFLERMFAGEALAGVEHVHFGGGYTHICKHVEILLGSDWATEHLRRLTAKDIYYTRDVGKFWSQIFATDFGGHLEVLDLSGFYMSSGRKSDDKKLSAMLERELPQARLLDHVDTLVLGKWKTDSLTEKLAGAFPELTVQ